MRSLPLCIQGTSNLENSMEDKAIRKETLWFFLAFVVAVCLRFIKLGVLPLGNAEAAIAMQALNLSRGTATVVSGQPIYVALTSLLFSVFSSSGFWALFWPALFGSALVFVPILYKNYFSKNFSIVLAFFFAIDPGLVSLSRTANANMIMIVSLLAAIGFMLKKRSLWAGVCFGLAILSGTSFWPALIVLVIVWLMYGLSRRRNTSEEQLAPGLSFTGINWKLFSLACLVTVGLIGTAFVLHPSILSGIGSGFSEYFSSLVKGSGVPISRMLFSLPLSEVLIIPLAIWGLVTGLKRKDTITECLGYMFVLFMILILVNSSRQVQDWTLAIIPLTFLAALGMMDLISKLILQEYVVTIIQATVTISLCVFSFLNLLSFTVNSPTDAVQFRNGILEIVLPLVFLVMVTILLAWGWSMIGSRQGLIIGFGLMFLFITFGSAWKAAGLGPRPEAELWRSDPLPTGAPIAMKTVNDLALWSSGQKNSIDVSVDNLDQPALLWSLRDVEKVTSVDTLGKDETPSIFFSSSDATPGLIASYRGQNIIWSSSLDFDNMNAGNWLKWFVYRQAPELHYNLLLWARNDLFKGSTSK
jgi:hypothetical protein